MNKHPRRALVAATATIFAGALSVGTATAAQAATAPSCVTAHVTNSNHDVDVTNTCSSRQRVKVIWAYAGDSACHVLGPSSGSYFDARFSDHRDYPAHFDGLQSC